MATEIGRLTAVFEAQTRQFDVAVKNVEQKLTQTAKTADKTTQSVKGGFDSVTRSLSSLPGPLGNVSSQVSSAASELAGMGATAGGLAAGGLVALVGAATAAGHAIFTLTTNVAEATGKFVDLSQQTGFSVETLSALSNAAETSGGSINTVVGSLGIFERNMIEAQDSASEMSRLFKQLSLDTNDNEKALRQATEQLRRMPEGAAQTALAMKLFGRSGREVLGIVKEMDTTLDDYMETQRRANTLIGSDAAGAGDKYSDSLRELHRQLESVKRMVAGEFAPTILKAITDLTGVIQTNRGAVREWLDAFSDAARGARSLGEAVSTLGGLITGLNNIPIPGILQILASFSGAGGIFRGLQSLGASQRGGGLPAGQQGSILNQMNQLGGFSSVGRPNFSTFRPDNLRPPPGPRGVRGRSRTAPERDEFTELLKRQQKELGSLAATTEVARTALELLDDQYKSLLPEQRNQILTIARQIDVERQRLAIQNEVKSFMDGQNQSIRELSESLNTHLGRSDAQIKAWERMGAVIPATISWWTRFNATILDSAGALERMTEWLERASDLLPGQGFAVPEFDPNIIGRALEGQLGPPPVDRSEEIARIRAQMEQLASDVTGLFDRALYDGISGGAKRGLQSLALGFLDIIQQIVLGKLKSALAEALSGLGGEKSGGGFFSGLLRSILGGVVGGAAGGGGMGQSRAGGGPMWPGEVYRVHKDETIVPMSPQFVIPKTGMGEQVVNNYNISVPVQRGSSASTPRSRRQIAEDISSVLQGALT